MTRRLLIVATANPAKVAQLAELVAGLAEVRAADRDISPGKDAETELGEDLQEIARRKAIACSRIQPEQLVVATDGGLIVPALTAWRPARTKRFAGDAASNRERVEALLSLAAGLTGDQRQIWWREAMAVARAGSVRVSWVAESPPGLLATDFDPGEPAGDNGFWLPSLWRCPEFDGKRLSQLTSVERASRQDHWKQLGQELRTWLETI